MFNLAINNSQNCLILTEHSPDNHFWFSQMHLSEVKLIHQCINYLHLLYSVNFDTSWEKKDFYMRQPIIFSNNYLQVFATLRRDTPHKTKKILNSINVQVLFVKNIKKKHLCRHDKNYYYFCKSNISLINLIVGSKNYDQSFKKYEFYTDNFFCVFYCFWIGQSFQKYNG